MIFLRDRDHMCIHLIIGYQQFFVFTIFPVLAKKFMSCKELVEYIQGIFYLFHACDSCMLEAALFQNIFKFHTFLPKFLNI